MNRIDSRFWALWYVCFFFLLFRNVIDIALVLHGNVIFKKLCISKRLCFVLDFHIHKFDRQVKYICVCAYGSGALCVCIGKDYRISLRCNVFLYYPSRPWVYSYTCNCHLHYTPPHSSFLWDKIPDCLWTGNTAPVIKIMLFLSLALRWQRWPVKESRKIILYVKASKKPHKSIARGVYMSMLVISSSCPL